MLQVAVVNTRERWPRLHLAGAAAPMIDLEHCTADEDAVIEEIARTRPHLLFLFLGAPKQEKWYWRNAARLPTGAALGLGGAVEILAGTKQRPPQWAQTWGLEWCWRMFQDPKRLVHRYLVRDLAFVGIAARQIVGRWA